MAVNAINSAVQIETLLPKSTKKTTDTTKSTSIPLNDVVAKRDTTFAFKVYTQETLSKVAAVAKQAADMLGVDLNTVDASPEATADRITSFVFGMYSTYRKQHSELTDEEALDKYEKVIGRAIDKGYNEALKILDGLGVNDETTMAGIHKTHELIFQKLDSFFSEQRSLLAQATESLEAAEA
ncbi:MAG: DUF5610 domain-containing protein [Myxococcales bacterium]|nr:DUF5610 domain-containing protein [Myxococcales bacterium]